MPHKQFKPRSPQDWRKRQVRKVVSKKTGVKSSRRAINSPLRKKVSLKTRKQKILTWVTSGTLGLVIMFFIVVAWMSRDLPKSTTIVERDVPQSTKIFDRTGQVVLFEVFAEEQRTSVNLDDLPNHIKWAAIAAEDRNFYSHAGIKFTSIIRAVIANLLSGSRGQGGSTITQQFIKNAVLTTEKTYTRKIKEIILAWQLERRFSKDEILELYFNEIPYGSTSYGIESAAQRYFGKAANGLSLAEAATLAALPQAPSYYSPYGSNKDELLARKDFVLSAMADEGYITQTQAETASEEELNFKAFGSSIKAPHFVFYIKELLAERYGETAIEKGGLQVITSLDLFKQDLAEEIITERGEFNAENFEANNAAMLVLDPKTGEILAMVGSRDFFNEDIDGEVNVTLRPRQPGSSFKPIVYATAFQEGLTPETMIFDLETTFKVFPEDYEPKNYNGAINGPVTIRQSLGSSLNIPAVKTTYLIGVDKVLDTADKLHYTTLEDRSRFGLSLTLGGAEVTMIEHLSAFAALAREGIYHAPVGILKVKDKNNKVLEEFKPEAQEGEEVMDSQIARLVTNVLTDNQARLLTFQENNYLYLGDRPVAAKTGTTNDFRDAWTLGYTPSLAVAVWAGNNDNSTMGEGAAGGAVASPIWNQYMRRVLGDTPIEIFNEPEEYTTSLKPMLNGSLATNSGVIIDTMSGLLATEYTPSTTRVERNYGEIHNILHYVRPGNVLGPIPQKPWDEPNYTNWEIPVEKWLEENNYVAGEAPTEFDNIHLQQDQPNLNLSSIPTEITTNNISLTFSASAPRGIRRIDYYIDETLINSNQIGGPTSLDNQNVNLNLRAGITNGKHTLRVGVYDDLDNEEIVSHAFTLNR